MHVQKEEKLNLFQKQDTNIAGKKQLLIMELSLLIVKDVDIINSRNYIYICILSFKLNENKFIMTYIIKYVAPYHTNDFNETLKTCFCCGQEFPEINSLHFDHILSLLYLFQIREIIWKKHLQKNYR